MKAAKEFDCVALKDEIHRKLLARRSGMTDVDEREDIRRRLAASRSPVGQLWRRLRSRKGLSRRPAAVGR